MTATLVAVAGLGASLASGPAGGPVGAWVGGWAGGRAVCRAAAPGELQPWEPGDSDIIISEIHYHPPDGRSPYDGNAEEFVELFNRGLRWVDLTGWRFTTGIELTFPEGTILAPQAYLVVARDRASIVARRGVANVVGDFKGGLADTGEILILRNRAGRVVARIHYRDGRGPEGGLWPEAPDGGGPSLELISPHPDWPQPWYWGSSRVPGGTPGRRNSRWEAALGAPSMSGTAASGTAASGTAAARRKRDEDEPPDFRLNETRLVDPDPFVEILNDGTGTLSLEGLRLTRDPHGRGGLELEGSVPKGRHHVLRGADLGAILSGGCDVLFLVVGATREIVDALELRTALPPKGSSGRYPDAVGGGVTFSKATPGAANEPPVPAKVVINEILYHGLKGKKAEAEFIELHNWGRSPVPLEGWRIRRAASFDFPDDAALPPDGYVVVASEPEPLRASLGPALAKAVFGPLKGKLSNSGETIVVRDQWDNEVDRVRYTDRPPWPKAADGGGYSLELLHPELENSLCQAWTLGRPGGSPGQRNGRYVKTMRPAIDGVRHEPPVPRPGEAVTIHAHVLDTGSMSEVAVIYRELGPGGSPRKKTLSDSGGRDDGAPRDGHYAGRLSGFPAGALVAFTIVAKDSSGRLGQAPERKGGEYYFQVEAPSPSAGLPGMPVYRMVMPPDTWAAFMKSDRRQDNWFQGTFIAGIEGPGVNRQRGRVFYDSEIRYRGNNSRNPPDGRMSYRVRLAGGELHDGRDRLILNAFAPHRQKAGGDVLRIAGVPVSDATVVRFKTPTFDDCRYVDVEVVNNEFLDDKFGASDGDVFRGMRPRGRAFGADLSYHGPDPAPYLEVYVRMNKKGDDSIPGLLRLLEVLDTKDDAAYVEKVSEVLDPEQWAMYFAANNALGNTEGGLSTGHPDDYFIAEDPDDGRFLLVAWDQDETFHKVDLELYPNRLPTTHRLLTHPRFAPLYHRAVRQLTDDILSLATVRERLRRLDGVFPPEDLAGLERFVRRRGEYLRENYPLTAHASLAEASAPSGAGARLFVKGGTGDLALAGRVDPALAFGVRVDADLAAYDAVTGAWTLHRASAALSPGPNPIWLSFLDAAGEPADLFPVNLQLVPSFQEAPASIAGSVRWEASAGPCIIRGETVVREGAVLSVGPGVNVVCGPEAAIRVRGRLEVLGTPLEPVAFRPSDAARAWGGIHLSRTGTSDLSPAHRISDCRFEGGRGAGDGTGGPLDEAFVRVEGARLTLERCLFRGIRGVAVGAEGSTLALRGVRVLDSRHGVDVRAGIAVIEDVQGLRLHGDGIRLERLDRGESRVSGAVLRDVDRRGVVVQGGRVALERILVHGGAVGIEVRGGAQVRASRCTLAGIGTGILVDREAAFEAVAGAAPGAAATARRAGGAGGAGARSKVELSLSVIGPTYDPFLLRAPQGLELSSVVYDGVRIPASPPAGKGVVASPVQYRAPRLGDFRLEDGSPGHAAGPDGADLGYAAVEPRATASVR